MFRHCYCSPQAKSFRCFARPTIECGQIPLKALNPFPIKLSSRPSGA
ncbi:hypothetical protein PFWH6_2281 [Pseudomonas fluorescens WH6]|nr:hypothetical protein PFWH6_2281 [Pseudomonas fluorescens WH6]